MFDTKMEGRRWLNTELAKLASGQLTDGGDLTVATYFTDWLGSLGMAQLAPSTLSWYRSAVERHIVPSLGAAKLEKLHRHPGRELPQ